MKYLKTYQQINESKGSDILKDLLDKFSKKIDGKKLAELLIPNKNLLLPYYKKYCINGVINADMIYVDFSKLNFKANEGYWDPEDYADDKENNPLLRFLYKLFVRWPKSFITGLGSIFYDTVVDTWKDNSFVGKLLSVMMSILWVGVAIFVYIIGYITYEFTEHAIRGLDKGKVETEKFEPAHYEQVPHTMMVGKTTMTYYTNDYISDRWHIEVVGDNGREEWWHTYNGDVAKNITKGQEVTNDDDWTWEGTEKR